MNEFEKLFGALVLYFIFIRGCHGDCVTQSEAIKHELFKSGSSFYENCCSTNKNSILRWLDHNNEEVTFGPGTDSNVYTEKNGDEINLFIKKLSKGTTYNYTCSAEIDGKNFTLRHVIEVYDPPLIYNTNKTQNIIKGTDAVVYCWVSPVNDSTIYTEWYRVKLEEIQIIEDDKYNISTNTGLSIKNVDDEDGGIYICRATHYISGDVVDKEIHVEVVTLPVIQSIKVTPQHIVKEGDKVTIECIAQGQPHPTYKWRRLSTQKNYSTTWRQNINIITTEVADRDDSGIYECTAQNLGGSANSTIEIQVKYGPAITEFRNITALEGSIAQLICKASGNPVPDNVIWTDLDLGQAQPFISHNTTKTEESIFVTFTNISRYHGGLYHCNSNNSIDLVTADAYVNVLHYPSIIGSSKETIWGWNEKTLNLSCENESNPPAVIKWNFMGNNSILDDPQVITEVMKNISINLDYATITISSEAYYGIYECVIVNQFGYDAKRFNLKRAYIPGPIENATVNEVKPTSVVFDIVGPPESKITGYMAQYDELENFNITNIHFNRTWSVDRPYRLDKLKPETVYNVRFAAKNELGDGDWSDYLVFNTQESMVPDAPTWNYDSQTSAALRDNTESSTIQVKWDEPENNGDPIDYYILRYWATNTDEKNSDEDLMSKDLKIKGNELTIDNLEPNTTYRIEILAHNSVGNSTVTSASITTSAQTIGPPTSLLSAGAIIAISVVTVFICLFILDIILFLWQKKGIIASCFNKKKKKEDNFNSRDNKGLLKHSTESDDTLRRTDNRQRPAEYKSTGVITGKHSAV